MKWNVAAKIGLGFGIVLAIFTAVSVVSYLSTNALIETSDTRQDSYEVLSRLMEIDAIAVEMQNGFRGYAITGDESHLALYQKGIDRTEAAIREIRAVAKNNPRHKERLDALEPVIRNRLDSARKTNAMVREKGPEAALQFTRSAQGRGATNEFRTILDQVEGEERKLLTERSDATQSDARRASWTIILGTLIAILLSAVTAYILARSIGGPLKALTVVAERVTAGDLNVEVAVGARSDEVGALSLAFDRMIRSLRKMANMAEQIAAGDLRATIEPQSAADVLGHAFARMSANLRGQIRGLIEGTNVLGSAASEIVASTSQLAASASEAAAAVSETTTTVEEVRQTAEVASAKARHVSENAQQAAQNVKSGSKSTDDVAAGMSRIKDQMEAIAASMTRLSEQGQAIGQIMASVEDLAAQSNLLAVNAAIEAAKAGEHGKGFGVVAQEVKSLAEQSRQATNQVRTILGDIQKATASAVMATEEGGKAVAAGTRQTEMAGGSIQALAVSVNEAVQAATQIAASSQQQLVGVDQVAGAMDSIKRASTQNVASAKQLEAAARNLNELGQKLKGMIELYQV